MLFVPEMARETLSSLVAELADGFYGLARFELPENLWEQTFDRLDPVRTMTFLRNETGKLLLNQEVRAANYLKYDNPGDFQLMLRHDILRIGGFNEAMVHGWHVDANLCKRMFLLYGEIGSLQAHIKGYHCNHTRVASSVHHQHRFENDWARFVHQVKSPYLSPLKADWGLADEEVEEVRLHASSHCHALKEALHDATEVAPFLLDFSTYNRTTYSAAAVLPYLADHLIYMPRNACIGYVGGQLPLLEALKVYLKQMDWKGELVECSPNIDAQIFYHRVSLIIFDFGLAPGESRQKLKAVLHSFIRWIKCEKQHHRQIKFIGLNVLHTDFKTLFHKHLLLANTSFVTGLVYGYVPSGQKRDSKKPLLFKKRTLLLLRYLLVRHFFEHADRLRHFLQSKGLLQKLVKSSKW